MPALNDRPSIRFSRTEDDEVIGTVRQFSDHLNLPAPQVLPCLQENDDPSIILRAGQDPNPLLILDSGAMEALQQCAGKETTA